MTNLPSLPSLDRLTPATPIAEWAAFVRSLRDARAAIKAIEIRAIAWGVDVYGEPAYTYLSELYEPGTIANYLSIARRVSPKLIEEGHSVSTLGEVRALPQAEQVEVIRAAEAEGWSRQELREEVAHRLGRAVVTPALVDERDTVETIKRLWATLKPATQARLYKELKP